MISLICICPLIKEADEAKRAEADATRKAKVKAQVEEFSREKEGARRIAEEERKLKVRAY